jgi:hypothetical protein
LLAMNAGGVAWTKVEGGWVRADYRAVAYVDQ